MTERDEEYYAHIDINSGRKQTLSEHLYNVARRAQEILTPFGMGNTGYLIGLLHDMGKFSTQFQQYLCKAANGEKVTRGSVTHSTCGMQYLFEFYGEDRRKPAVELCGFAVASHHGLMDCVDTENNSVFFKKQENQDKKQYSECKKRYEQIFKREETEKLLEKATEELEELEEKARTKLKSFEWGELARMVLSALIEADHADTAAFTDGQPECKQEREETERIFRSMRENAERNVKKLEETAAHLPINGVRREISRQCKESAVRESGVYRLSVPTGGGKTCAALRFALNHCLLHQKRRIIYTAPLLTVLDQNADEIRKLVGEENERYVLEHTSDIVKSEFSEEEAERYERLSCSWDSPVIVTTQVQLLHTFFAGKSRNIRRFHSLFGSVIIIDEVQSVPLKLTNLFNDTVNFLAKVCDCTIVLCSATQPKLSKAIEEKNKEKKFLKPIKDCGTLVTLTSEQIKVFERTRIVNLLSEGGYSEDQLADRILSLSDKKSVLLICNTKKQAASIFRRLQYHKDGFALFHLSAGMCKAHRQDVLKEVEQSLQSDSRTVLVSTQVVEAGVDISFECVIRLLAGVDSLAQSAGRCNRHGEFGKVCDVYLVKMQDENLKAFKEMEMAQKATEGVARFSSDLLSAEAIERYYNTFYQRFEPEELSFPIREPIRNTLYQLLSTGFYGRYGKNYFCNQAFRTAGEKFRVFDEESYTVIVPYKESMALYAELFTARAEKDIEYVKSILEKLKPYTVSLYRYRKAKIEDNYGLTSKEVFGQTVYCLEEGFYDETGVSEEDIRLKGGF